MNLTFEWPQNDHPHHVRYRWRLETDWGATIEEGETTATSVEVTVPEVVGRVGYLMIVDWFHARSGKWSYYHTTPVQWAEEPTPEPEPEPEPTPDPEPTPEGPHPAVPHIDHDPTGNPVATTHRDTMAPASVTLTALGQTQRLVALVEPQEGTGQVYTWVTLPDGRHGLWGCASVDREAGTAVLAEAGPWIHTGIPWTAEVEALPAGDGDAEYEWGWTVLHEPLPDWTTIGGREVSHLEVTAEPVSEMLAVGLAESPHVASENPVLVTFTGDEEVGVEWPVVGNVAGVYELGAFVDGKQLPGDVARLEVT